MSELNSIATIEYHKKRYTVASLNLFVQKTKRNITIPILLDRHIYRMLKQLSKTWYINDTSQVYCIHHNNGKSHLVYMHDIVLKLSGQTVNKSVIHINNIHFDNRIDNLQLDTTNKDYTKNMSKKKRIINLKKHKIDADKLPSYIWYAKPDATHGDRFVICVPGVLYWSTTSSKKVSLRYKLEEAKKYLRYIRDDKPEMFLECCMNGDLTQRGTELYKEYYMMIKKVGYAISMPNKVTDEYLEEDLDNLTLAEIYLLHNFNPHTGSIDICNGLAEYKNIMNE